ncbi:hypothetical protein [Bacteroides faecium]|uniref:Uncharacterized protein n=1 Tax=Bacteroides faecium TaxID=2715212 RepID=A0A6H0KJU3_9BACE|nr:hypothetical protein [Bacteroides faecium]QIU93565.1 hypothetical protein BacF7301_05085 [Bacteroides faecium]
MKQEISLSTEQSTSTSSCKNCKRELPLDFFYLNKTTLCPDKFCKECRKSLSRRRYNSGKISQAIFSDRLPYPVITQIEDRETRIQFILHALQVVRLSMERKRMRTQEEDALL